MAAGSTNSQTAAHATFSTHTTRPAHSKRRLLPGSQQSLLTLARGPAPHGRAHPAAGCAGVPALPPRVLHLSSAQRQKMRMVRGVPQLLARLATGSLLQIAQASISWHLASR